MIIYKTNVLLPEWLLEQEAILSQHDFIVQVCKYLQKYPDYELFEMKNGFAVCKRKEDWNG